MGNLSTAPQKTLPEFQKFLLERNLVPEKNVPYFAYWVSRFLAFARKRDISAAEYRETVAIEFLDMLRTDNKILDWQPRQADDAIKLYYFHYLGNSVSQLSGTASGGDVPSVLKEIKRLIRLRHYSYSTERTYLQWVERFFAYALQSGGKGVADLTSNDFKDFLSHLALKQKVSASTQNQAFNAILFLFRHALGKETGGLADTVRAKRGQKLPVVFSLDEVKKLFGQMDGTNRLVAELLYGSGLRLMEIARLRVKDIDFDANTLFVRSGKGDKDRSTVLPSLVQEKLQEHLRKVKVMHEKDLSDGHGEVHLPDALGRKYPKAGREWAWQYVFPSSKLSVDPRSGKVGRHHDSAIPPWPRSGFPA